MNMDLCRICLDSANEGVCLKERVFGVEIRSCIEEIGNVMVDFEDGLPQKICCNCSEGLQAAWKFKKTIEASDAQLRCLEFKPEPKFTTIFFDPEVEIKEEVDELEPDDFQGSPDESKPLVRPRKTRRPPACCMCGESFSSEARLKEHCQALHPEGVPEDKFLSSRHSFHCQYCKRRFRTRKYWVEHYKDVNFQEPKRDRSKQKTYKKKQETKVQCPTCGLILYGKRGLELHEAAKHSSRHLLCGIDGCKSAFAHQKALTCHQQQSHGEKKFTCDFCGRSYFYLRQLKQHLFIHVENKPFQCDQCSKSYAFKQVLEAHKIANHSAVKHFFQCELCPKAYRWQRDLAAHKITHTGKFPFCCRHCGKGYTSGSSRNYHEQRCTQTEPSFAMPQSLQIMKPEL